MATVNNVGANVVITSNSAGLTATIKATQELVASMTAVQAKLKETIATATAQASAMSTMTTETTAAARALNSLAVAGVDEAKAQEISLTARKASIAALKQQLAAIEAGVGGHKALTFGMAEVDKATAQSRQQFKAWQAEMHRSGANLVSTLDRVGGREVKSASNLRELFQNQRALNTSIARGLSGIASDSSINSLFQRGYGAFQRNLTVMERFRLKTQQVKRDLFSMFQTWQNSAKQSQWIGRQMMMGITIPLMAIGAAAVYAFTKVRDEQARLQKITYNPGETWQEGTERIKRDYIPAIRQISQEYGQVESITTAVAGDWAAMGFSTKEQNAQMTELVSQWSLLGDMDLSDTTDYIRKIFATFGNNDLDQTTEILNRLNGIEEVAAINLKDLATAMPQVAQSANAYGMSAEELAATLAGMVEKGVDANEAAHALKFSLQRMYNPTTKASEALKAMGIEAFDPVTKKAKPALDLFREIGQALPNFTEQFQSQAIGDIFASRQVDRIRAAMKSITESGSDFADAMQVASMSGEEAAKKTADQLEAMQSSPAFKLKQLKAQLQMFAADLGGFLIDPLLKAMTVLNSFLKKLLALPDGTKKVIASFIIALSVIGPMVYVTSVLGEAFATVGKGLTHLIPGMTELTAEAAQGTSAMAVLKQKVIQVGNAFFFTGKKHEMAKLEAERARDVIVKAEGEKAAAIALTTAAIDAESDALKRQAEESLGFRIEEGGLGPMFRSTRGKDKGRFISPAEAARRARNPRGPDGRFLGSAERGIAQDAGGVAEEAAVDVADAGDDAAVGFIGKFWDKIKSMLSAGKNSILKLFGSGAAVATGGEAVGAEMAGGITSGLSSGLSSTGIGAIIVAAVVAIIFVIKSLISNWNKFKQGFSDGWNEYVDALKQLWHAFDPVIDVVKDLFNAFDDGSSKSKKAGNTWKQIGTIIGAAAKFSAGTIRILAGAIHWLLETFVNYTQEVWGFLRIGDLLRQWLEQISDLFKAVSEAIKGHWGNAMKYLVQAMMPTLGPILRGVEVIYDGVLSFVQKIVDLAGDAARAAARLHIPGASGAARMFSGWSEDIEGMIGQSFSRGIEDWANSAVIATGRVRDRAHDAGRDIGNDVNDGIEESAAPGPALEDNLDEWLPDWLSAVKSRLDQVVSDLKDAALKALDTRYAANLKVFDDRIAAIDAVEKAEDRALRAKEYRENRRKMIEDRALQHDNYRRDRALAIYEGRIDDARMLDLEEVKNQRDHSRAMADAEASRRREIIQQQRDDYKQSLNDQKDALDERQKLLRESFEKQLDMITEYAPKTIGEFQSMLGSITNLLGQYGINMWPGMMATGMSLFNQVIQDANKDILETAAWSGNSAATAWLAAFISGDARAAILAGSSDAPTNDIIANAGGGGGAGGGGSRNWRNPDTGVGASHYNRSFHTGGFLGGGAPSDIPITAQTGEYVVQRKAVQNLGVPFLDALNTYHTGGLVMPNPGKFGGSQPLQRVVQPALQGLILGLTRNWMDANTSTTIGGADPHAIYSAFQGGGTVGGKKMSDFFSSFMTGEGEPIQRFANWVNATFPGSRAATGIGTHSINVAGTNRVSLHTLHRAIDVGGPDGVLTSVWNYMLGAAQNNTIPIQELIFKHLIWSMSRGLHPYTKNDHMTHVHIGLREGFQNLMTAMIGGPGAPAGASTPGSLALKMQVREAAKQKWGTDSYWNSLDQLISHESSWNPYADNPTSSAYGLFQFLNSTRANYGITTNASIADQIRTGLQYIQDRYQNPNNAWALWQSRSPHWYHGGGLIGPAMMASGGIVPYDNFPALLHKNEVVVPAPYKDSVVGGHGPDCGKTELVFNGPFLGDFDWFCDKMEEYDIKVVPKKNRAKGNVNRRIGVR